MKLLALIIISVLVLTGCTQQQSNQAASQPQPSEQATTVSETGSGISGSTVYAGEVLAGSSAPLLDFNKADYDSALASDKLVVLYFYATWCPICKAEIPELYGAFDELNTENVIGFRVNFNDGDTDDDERDLARKYGVSYQHTKIFVKNGQRILKSPESWDKERYLEEINSNVYGW